MKMRNAILILLVVAVTAIGFWFFSMGGSNRVNADQIISRIEEYRRREGRLPDPANHSLMQTLGFELRVGWCPDYEPLDATNYRITIIEGFDGPCWFYESKSNQWSHGYPATPNKVIENGQNKTDAGNGSKAICRVIDASRLPSPDPRRSAGKNEDCETPSSRYCFSMILKAIVHEAEEGGFWAEVPSLPGCFTQGETLEELESNVHEAIEGWLLAAEPEITLLSEGKILEVAV